MIDRNAVVVLSGGLDSTATAYFAKSLLPSNGKLFALSFKYGQVHADKELACAAKTALKLGMEHNILSYDLAQVTKSALLGMGDIPISGVEKGIPSTWVPQRNSLFLTLAFAYAEVVDAKFVYIGVNSIDYSGYPDCRPQFISAMENALNLASKRFVEESRQIFIRAPLQYLTKSEIIGKGIELGVPFEDTWSCYQGGEVACGVCDSCRIRLAAFAEQGIDDPIEYVEGVR